MTFIHNDIPSGAYGGNSFLSACSKNTYNAHNLNNEDYTIKIGTDDKGYAITVAESNEEQCL